jgi:hypothetical protein
MEWLSRDLIVGPYLALALCEKDFHSALRHCEVPVSEWPHWLKGTANAAAHTLTNPDGGLVCVVCLGSCEGREPIQIASLLVHEAVHVWQSWCEHAGEARPSEEFEAYSIQAISQRLMYAYAESLGK